MGTAIPADPGSEAGRPPQAELAAVEPLSLRLAIDARKGRRSVAASGRAISGEGETALLRVTASTPCHLAVYRIGRSLRITPLLSLSGAARMRPAGAYRLALRVDNESGDRIVAIGSRRPLAGSEARSCLQRFLSEAASDEDAPASTLPPISLMSALRALAGYAGRGASATVGTASDQLTRTDWAVATTVL